LDTNQSCFNKDVIMTKIEIVKKNGIILGFKVKGHSGFAQEGSDIVCSAISMASQMTLGGLREVLSLDVESVVEDGFLQVRLTDKQANLSEAQALLKTFQLACETLVKDYARYIKMEVKEDVY